jgi:hypothetical protein
MAHPRPSHLRRLAPALIAASVLVLPIAAAPSAAADEAPPIGLFGSQPATFDGVYRQSLALLAYAAEGVEPPAEAVEWLLDQQCDDGAFEAFRADPSGPCAAPDPDAFVGPDTNATAVAAQALLALGEDAAAEDALGYLESVQNSDGGIPTIDGGLSDANSTGLAAMAVSAFGIDPSDATASTGNSLTDALDGLQVGCEAPDAEHGAYAFRADFGINANDFATVQALVGRAGVALPVLPDSAASTSAPRLDCGDGGTTDEVEAAAGYLADRLAANDGVIPDAFTPSAIDWGSTRGAVLALAASGLGRDSLVAAWKELDANQPTFLVGDDGNDRPGALAEMILATNAAAPSLAAAGLDVTTVRRAVAVGSTDTSALLERLEATLNQAPDEPSTDPDQDEDGSGSGSPIPATDATKGGTEIADTGNASAPLAWSGALLLLAGTVLITAGRRIPTE